MVIRLSKSFYFNYLNAEPVGSKKLNNGDIVCHGQIGGIKCSPNMNGDILYGDIAGPGMGCVTFHTNKYGANQLYFGV